MPDEPVLEPSAPTAPNSADTLVFLVEQLLGLGVIPRILELDPSGRLRLEVASVDRERTTARTEGPRPGSVDWYRSQAARNK